MITINMPSEIMGIIVFLFLLMGFLGWLIFVIWGWIYLYKHIRFAVFKFYLTSKYKNTRGENE